MLVNRKCMGEILNHALGGIIRQRWRVRHSSPRVFTRDGLLQVNAAHCIKQVEALKPIKQTMHVSNALLFRFNIPVRMERMPRVEHKSLVRIIHARK